MGMTKKPSVSSLGLPIRPDQRTLPNPNPFNYVIKFAVSVGKHLVVRIHYPDCTNFEGQKILLFKNTTYEKLRQQKGIDPHFSDSKTALHPFARFVPTDEGWNCAVRLAQTMR